MSLSTGSNYKIIESFGMGGMGTVYRARDILLNREVAIKILLPQFSRNPEWLRRFRHEAQTLAALNHPTF